jgi:hypothetical protein
MCTKISSESRKRRISHLLTEILGCHDGRYQYGCLLGNDHRPDDGGTKHLCDVGKLSNYTAQQPKKQPSSINYYVEFCIQKPVSS